jgi:hypothetical protein
MRTRNAEIQRVAVATVVSDQGRADAGRWKKASAIAIALPHHGGLTPAALANVRSCIAKIVFSPANGRTAPRAGGVSPPWFATATPPAFASTPPAVPRDFAEALLQVRFPNTHGGLTPAALVHVRFCIAKIVILSADGRCNTAKSGGRKPPVEKALLC